MKSRSQSADPGHLSIRSDWLDRVVGDCHTLVDPSASPDPAIVARRFQEFLQSLPSARTLPEKLVLRGLLLEVYVQLETSLGRLGVDETVRDRGRHVWLQDRHRASRPELLFQHACEPLLESWQDLLRHPIHEQARRWIAANWAGPLSIVRLARELHVHPRTLRRSFRKHLGVSVHQHWRDVRAREAVRLLQETSIKIEAIALLVGCRHRSTFYQMVKSITGKTPTQLRQEPK